MRAPIYLNIYFSETKKKQKTATQNMKHTTYLFRGSWQSPISANEWIVLALFFKAFAAHPVVFVT